MYYIGHGCESLDTGGDGILGGEVGGSGSDGLGSAVAPGCEHVLGAAAEDLGAGADGVAGAWDPLHEAGGDAVGVTHGESESGRKRLDGGGGQGLEGGGDAGGRSHGQVLQCGCAGKEPLNAVN